MTYPEDAIYKTILVVDDKKTIHYTIEQLFLNAYNVVNNYLLRLVNIYVNIMP